MKNKRSARMIYGDIRTTFNAVGYCDDVSIDIYNNWSGIINLGKNKEEKRIIAQNMLNMLSGRELCEMLPILKIYGAIYKTKSILDRLDEFYLDEGKIRHLIAGGIPVEKIADRFCDSYNFWTFVDAGLSPMWLFSGSANAMIAKTDFVYYYNEVERLLKATAPEYRKLFFESFLEEMKIGGPVRFRRDKFFSMEPLLEIGMSADDIIQLILGNGISENDIVQELLDDYDPYGMSYNQAYEAFREKECFVKLRLNVDVRDYLVPYFRGAYLNGEHSAFEEITWVCMQYALDANDVMDKIDMDYLIPYLKTASFSHFVKMHRYLFADFDYEKFAEHLVRKLGYPKNEGAWKDDVMRLYQDIIRLSGGKVTAIDREKISS